MAILGLLISVGIQFYNLPAIASFLGSLVGAGATFTVAYMAREISKQQAKIAEEQRDIAKKKLDLDRFNKRFETFVMWKDSLKKIFKAIGEYRSTNNKKEEKDKKTKIKILLLELCHSGFLMGFCFGDGIKSKCFNIVGLFGSKDLKTFKDVNDITTIINKIDREVAKIMRIENNNLK